MKSQRQLGWFLVALLLFAFSTSALFAQDGENSGLPTNIPNDTGGPANPGNPVNDPPSRVARIQYVSGEVSLQPGGVNDWVAASLNRPLTTSDRVWTDKNSRAELNVGSAFLRMDSESSLTLTNVANNTMQAELDQGELEVTVLHLEPGEVYEIDTPNLAFTVTKPGIYRIDVRPNDDQTFVTVRKGDGQASGNGPAVNINSGEQVRFTGQGSLEHAASAAPAPDSFDDWAQIRDKRLDGSQSAQYVAPGVIGYQDLDYYGKWQTVPQYGPIWVPNSVPVGWAPYRFGHWVWVAPWGWTWVDDAPWGFAPFHYGRWVFYGGYWGWAPGPVYVGWRPYYAPALVGWIGGGGWGFGISVGVGFGFGGGCGWFPLGWGEPYYPWYHGYRGGWVSNTYVRNVNITNTHITNITNVTNNYYNNINNTHFVNRNVAGAVTAAPKSALANGQNIAKVGMAVPRSELGKGQVVRNVDVTPTHQAMMGGQAATGRAVPPRTAFSRPVVTQNTPLARQASQPLEAHNAPQPPATSGVHSPNTMNASPSQNVPRPAQRSDRANTASTSGYPPQSGSQHAVPKPPYAGGPIPAANSASQHNSPAYSNQAANSAAQHNSPNYSNQHSVPQPPHAASHVTQPPASQNQNHSTPPAGNSNESKPKESPKANPGMASSNVPHPPASYHAAPANAGSAYGGGNNRYNGGTRAYSAPAPSYSASPRTYGSPATAYRSGGGYSAAPTYNARAYAPAPQHYSAPAAPQHYTAPAAPHYSGGGGNSGGGGGHSNSSGGHSASHSR